MKIGIYAQHTRRAGERCWDEDMIERESDDINVFEGDDEEIKKYASSSMATHKAILASGHADEFNRRTAETLAESIGIIL